MPKDVLDEREFELINIIGAEFGSNQRNISRQLDLSLGMTNMLLRRLATKGFIRISQLNKRKVKYVLTPKGFAEKMRKSVKYTMKTISSITLIKEKVKEVVSQLYDAGERDFFVLGKSDFALLIDIVLKELNFNDYKISHFEEIPDGRLNGILMICKEDVDISQRPDLRAVDLIHELARDHTFINHRGSMP